MKKLNTYAIAFLAYSFAGWLYEVILEIFFWKVGFLDRGILQGPYCPIYGCGGLLLYFMLNKLKDKKINISKLNITPVICFVSIVIITSIVELIGSYIMEAITGGWMWDYTMYKINFQGRVALSTSLRFGLGGMVFLYFIQPLINKVADKAPDKIVNIIGIVIILTFIIDTIYTFFIL